MDKADLTNLTEAVAQILIQDLKTLDNDYFLTNNGVFSHYASLLTIDLFCFPSKPIFSFSGECGPHNFIGENYDINDPDSTKKAAEELHEWHTKSKENYDYPNPRN